MNKTLDYILFFLALATAGHLLYISGTQPLTMGLCWSWGLLTSCGFIMTLLGPMEDEPDVELGTLETWGVD